MHAYYITTKSCNIMQGCVCSVTALLPVTLVEYNIYCIFEQRSENDAASKTKKSTHQVTPIPNPCLWDIIRWVSRLISRKINFPICSAVFFPKQFS